MSPPGVDDDMAAARTALLDALDALRDQLDALVLIGAQAIYLWTGAADLAVAETTDDSDLAIDHRLLADDPLLEIAMTAAGFHRDPETRHFGSWLSPQNVPVDLMLPEAQSQKGGRRGALEVLFAAPESPGAQMAGRAEGLAGNPGVAAASAATLASDLIQWNAGRG